MGDRPIVSKPRVWLLGSLAAVLLVNPAAAQAAEVFVFAGGEIASDCAPIEAAGKSCMTLPSGEWQQRISTMLAAGEASDWKAVIADPDMPGSADVFRALRAQGIKVVAVGTDSGSETRDGFVGANPAALTANLAKFLTDAHPDGGTLCVVATGDPDPVHGPASGRFDQWTLNLLGTVKDAFTPPGGAAVGNATPVPTDPSTLIDFTSVDPLAGNQSWRSVPGCLGKSPDQAFAAGSQANATGYLVLSPNASLDRSAVTGNPSIAALIYTPPTSGVLATQELTVGLVEPPAWAGLWPKAGQLALDLTQQAQIDPSLFENRPKCGPACSSRGCDIVENLSEQRCPCSSHGCSVGQ